MKKQHSLKKIGLLVAVAFMTALYQVQAVDMAAASGMLAEVSVMSVQAQANLAVAASGGDLSAIADAAKRADAVDAALADAEKAYDALEAAAGEVDEDAANAALASLEAAHQKAADALNGNVPEPTQKTSQEQWKESKTNTGGGPEGAYDAPNIYDTPWQSAGLRSTSAAMFNSVNSSSGGSSANSNSYGDSDATPQ